VQNIKLGICGKNLEHQMLYRFYIYEVVVPSTSIEDRGVIAQPLLLTIMGIIRMLPLEICEHTILRRS